MKLFITIFILAILFVIGSASMMRFFDRKQLQHKQDADEDHQHPDK